ncbi:15-cis-phytoene synthase [Loktanella sp. SALINAS62]|uniref:15-cis-phytoene synthase n=1 Tax=Loktanella sp. SALINAS62 TaxID=2706124 RepID=UPI001B8AEBC5|nr:phytoene/squalene synthase family protein [Loktanella sp. SALINAS62]MBS1302276.1 phytoene/squalene synthase family protein [Loktanella sp. SALINAS62]
MIRPDDLDHCREVIRTGSLSFHAASRLLPASVRDPALALYAFCRLADDEVDEGQNKTAAVLRLRDRLDLAYAGRPMNAPEDRAFAAIIAEFDMPRALPDALLEGLAWDAQERRYATLSDLRDYAARVASAVGAMMCVLMRVRCADTLARACDLGVAMQLTNIARDIGEDARAGRIYLPTDWMHDAGIDIDRYMDSPQATPEIRAMTRALLREADRLYHRSEAGIGGLPRQARVGIWAARLIYAGIGGQVMRHGCDSITRRARTNKAQKLFWIGQAGVRACGAAVMPRSALIYADPLPETLFLVEAASKGQPMRRRMTSVLNTLADLSAREINRGNGSQSA